MKNNIAYSNEHLLYIKNIKKKNYTVIFFRIGILVTFLTLWELLARFEIIDSFLMSSPSRIIKTIISLYSSGELYLHLTTTLYETLSGFIIATTLGYIFAVILWWSEIIRRILEPYIVVLNSLPKIALGPIIIIWFGAGTESIIFMTVIITIIVTIINLTNGFLQTDKGKILLLKSLGATKFQTLVNLIIPSTLPTLISTLKVNVGMSWIGSIMGEYLVSKRGIGYLIVYGGQVFKLDLVMASTVILCILAGVMYAIIALIERKLPKRN